MNGWYRAASGTGRWPSRCRRSRVVAPAEHGQVVQDELADRFASAYTADPYGTFGPSMHDVHRAIGDGEPSWRSQPHSSTVEGPGATAPRRGSPSSAPGSPTTSTRSSNRRPCPWRSPTDPPKATAALSPSRPRWRFARSRPRTCCHRWPPAHPTARSPPAYASSSADRFLCGQPWIADEAGCGTLIFAPRHRAPRNLVRSTTGRSDRAAVWTRTPSHPGQPTGAALAPAAVTLRPVSRLRV